LVSPSLVVAIEAVVMESLGLTSLTHPVRPNKAGNIQKSRFLYNKFMAYLFLYA
jgi:hypothetical protein